MANDTDIQASGTGNQVVGEVFIIYGQVKAIPPDGVVRTLTVNSPIFAYDRIVTESDGSIAIMLNGPPPTQLDIGRMSDITIDEDVFSVVTPETLTEITADVEQIQQAITEITADVGQIQQATLSGDEDIGLEAAAAGGGTPEVVGIELSDVTFDNLDVDNLNSLLDDNGDDPLT